MRVPRGLIEVEPPALGWDQQMPNVGRVHQDPDPVDRQSQARKDLDHVEGGQIFAPIAPVGRRFP